MELLREAVYSLVVEGETPVKYGSAQQSSSNISNLLKEFITLDKRNLVRLCECGDGVGESNLTQTKCGRQQLGSYQGRCNRVRRIPQQRVVVRTETRTSLITLVSTEHA